MQRLRINLNHISQGLTIDIYAVIPNTIFKPPDAVENNEAEHQIVEGCFYQYKLNEDSFSLHENEIIEVSNFNQAEGRISPNFYVGTLPIAVYENGIKRGVFQIEVQSTKTSYRKDYRFMLESITKHAADLILQTNSPVNQTLEIDYDTASKTLYQQFCFVRSIIDTEEFDIAIQQIIKTPITNWSIKTENKDVRSLKKFSGKDVRNLLHSQKRVKLAQTHNLRNIGINTIALKISTSIKEESSDTPENRFIKYALESFLFFCEAIQLRSKYGSRLYQEAQTTSNKLESYLQHNLFKGVSRPTTVKLNSPILQKKAGYREVLKTWLMFDLAAKLIWEGGEDIYNAGSKNVAKLYEYWLFFKLLGAVKETFNINSEEYKKLICTTDDTLGLQLKEGKQIALSGSYISRERELSIQFSYNKTFNKSYDLSKEGSWTLQMNPDYTLSIWPKELDETEAETNEQIVHIHFDAKYKVKNKKDNSRFKNDDVIKMHAYKDAIRRTGGAYILYPGTDEKPTTFNGFHEVLPGLGAFAIRPSEKNSGINHLVEFIIEIKNHFLNRATQRENFAAKNYSIHKSNTPPEIREPIPEYIDGEKLIPDDTYILAGYYKDKIHLDWIIKSCFYNVRYNSKYNLSSSEINAKYLLLYTKSSLESNLFFKLNINGPKIYTKEQLKTQLNYPTDPSQDMYMIYELDEKLEKEFQNILWDTTNCSELSKDNRPFSLTLTKIMKMVKK